MHAQLYDAYTEHLFDAAIALRQPPSSLMALASYAFKYQTRGWKIVRYDEILAQIELFLSGFTGGFDFQQNIFMDSLEVCGLSCSDEELFLFRGFVTEGYLGKNRIHCRCLPEV